MDTASIGKAAGLVWKHLVERKTKPVPLTEVQKLKGIAANEAMAAVGWLAREGKLLFQEEGRTTKIQLTREELQAIAQSGAK